MIGAPLGRRELRFKREELEVAIIDHISGKEDITILGNKLMSNDANWC